MKRLRRERSDWPRWLGLGRRRERSSAERYFRWRKYWDYSRAAASRPDLYYHRLGSGAGGDGAADSRTRVTTSGGIYMSTRIAKFRTPIRRSSSTRASTSIFRDRLPGAGPCASIPQVIYGHRGTLLFEDEQLTVVPGGFLQPGDAKNKVYGVPAIDVMRAHTDDSSGACGPGLPAGAPGGARLPDHDCDQAGVDSYRDGAAKYVARPQTEAAGCFPPARRVRARTTRRAGRKRDERLVAARMVPETCGWRR